MHVQTLPGITCSNLTITMVSFWWVFTPYSSGFFIVNFKQVNADWEVNSKSTRSTHLRLNFPFIIPLKTSVKMRFSDDFRGYYRTGTINWKKLVSLNIKKYQIWIYKHQNLHWGPCLGSFIVNFDVSFQNWHKTLRLYISKNLSTLRREES